MAAVVARYLATREGRDGGLLGQLVCPVSRLPALVEELARSGPARPVDVSLVVDTGLGAVPKALSTVFSRSNLLTPGTIETAAPVDVDENPLAGAGGRVRAGRRRRGGRAPPAGGCGGGRRRELAGRGAPGREARLHTEAAVRRLPVVGGAVRRRGRPVRAGGGRRRARVRRAGASPVVSAPAPGGALRLGVLNLLVGAARALAHGAVAEALASTDGAALAREARALSPSQVREVRALLPRCGAGPAPVPPRSCRTCTFSAEPRPVIDTLGSATVPRLAFLGPHAPSPSRPC